MLLIEETIKKIAVDLDNNKIPNLTLEEWILIKKFICHNNKLATQFFCLHEDVEKVHEENAFPYGETYDYIVCKKCRKIF